MRVCWRVGEKRRTRGLQSFWDAPGRDQGRGGTISLEVEGHAAADLEVRRECQPGCEVVSAWTSAIARPY